MRTYGGFSLFLRSGLLTSVIVALAAGAHVIGGGALPHTGVLAALTAVALLPVTALARRRVHLRTAVLALGVGQFTLHHAFMALAIDGACGTGTADGSAHADPATHHLATAATATTAAVHCAGSASHLVPGSGHGGITMTIAHLAAILVTAAVIAGGDRALVLLLTWLSPLLDLLVPVVPLSGERVRLRSDVVCPVPPRRNGPTSRRRGPPLPGVAAAA